MVPVNPKDRNPAQRLLSGYLQLQLERYSLHRSLLVEQPGMEDVHQVRLIIKRMRSLWELLEMMEPGIFQGKKQLRKIDRLFLALASIRDYQVQSELMAGYAAAHDLAIGRLEKYISKREEKAATRMMKKLSKTGRRNFEKLMALVEAQLEDQYDDRQITAAINQTAAHYLDFIRKTGTSRLSDEDLHEIRRIIKSVHFLLGLTRSRSADVSRLKAHLRRLHDIEEFLGRWNDRVVGLDLLRSFFKKNRGLLQKQPQYKILWQLVHRDYAEMRKQVIRLLLDDLG